MVVRCLVLAWLLIPAALADPGVLTRVGDAWRFVPALGQDLVPPDRWHRVGFDDSFWSVGLSGFSLGYGSEETTVLPNLPTLYSAAYFRRTFAVTNLADIQWLTLRIDYSDGFVAYLNGREIARRYLAGDPGSFVAYNQLATNSHPRSFPEEFDVSAARTALAEGENVLAVQVHSSEPWQIGLYFTAELVANFTRAPFVQNMSSNRVQVIWKTPVPSDTTVEFGSGPTWERRISDTNLVTTHVVTLTDLAPDTEYAYEVSSSGMGRAVRSGGAHFRTFKTAGEVDFLVLGDAGWNSLAQYQIAESMRQFRADFVLETGDTVYPWFTGMLADIRCFSLYAPQMATTPFFFAIGNHDVNAGVGHFLEAFYLPTNSVPLAEHVAAQTSPEHYYSFDHGDVHIAVLYVPFFSQYKPRLGDAQYQWLVNDLATSKQPWKIVAWHVPMSTSSLHRADDMDLNGVFDKDEIRDVFLPVLRQYGVQLVLCGHEHGYERFNPIDGVHAITTAGGGVPLYGFSQLDEASALYWSRHNFVHIRIQGDELEARALGTDGQVFDRMYLRRRPPGPGPYRAAWASPVLETDAARQPDGNVIGQTFDLSGEPVPAVAGAFSNLGRAYCSNDATNLYLGFEGVMLYTNQSVFVFLEAPRLPGVSDLRGVGNGRFDPAGQGVEALDQLDQLEFTNFRPGVGAVLGDAKVDRQLRGPEPASDPAYSGQGVFRLDAILSDVPGARLEQFHLSPQVAGLPDHGRAQFIEVAIPLAELGDLQGGELIQVGAVVGYDRVQAGALDTTFLGGALNWSATGSWQLQGLSIQLAFDPNGDEDGDGLSRAQEQSLGTDPARPDSDGDGLPDGWEVRHNFNPRSSAEAEGGSGDADGDGASNWAEFWAGTDPRDARSVLRVEVTRSARQKVEMTWPAMADRTYDVEARDLGADTFQKLTDEGVRAAVGMTNLSYVVDLEPGHGARLFRVRVRE